MIANLIHFISIALSTISAALTVSISQGIATQASFDAINRQPAAQPDITRTTVLGLALIETAVLLGLLISFILIFNAPPSVAGAVGELGAALAIAIPGLIIGFASALPTREALHAIARQPFLAKKINNFMLLTQSLIQTPLIFGFIVALIIRNQLPSLTTVSQGLTLIGSGIAIGLGCVGPALGSGYFTSSACKSVGINKRAYTKLFTFTFMSQAIIETPVIFALIVSFLLTRQALSTAAHPLVGVAYMLFGTTIGLGTFGPGISSGRTAAAAALQIAFNPQAYNVISRASMLAQGLIDTVAIYAFIVALWLVLTPLV